MQFPIIRVRNKGEQGEGFVIGTNHHHQLKVTNDGNIEFVNVQCMDSTGSDEGYGYEFVTTEDTCWENQIEFGSIWDILNIYGEYLGVQDGECAEEFNKCLEQLRKVFDKAKRGQQEKEDEMHQKLFEKYFQNSTK